MSTFAEIQAKVKNRVLAGGANINVNAYTDRIKYAINWAQNEVCSVKWRFLLKTFTFDTVAEQTIYDTFDNGGTYLDFGRVKNVFIGTGTYRRELVPATDEDIDLLEPATTAGASPSFYSLSSVTTDAPTWERNVPALKIGVPAPAGIYPVTLHYYKRLAALDANSDLSLICEVHNDDALVEGGSYRLMLEVAPDKANPNEFHRAMMSMQAAIPFDGAGYPVKLQEREEG